MMKKVYYCDECSKELGEDNLRFCVRLSVVNRESFKRRQEIALSIPCEEFLISANNGFFCSRGCVELAINKAITQWGLKVGGGADGS